MELSSPVSSYPPQETPPISPCPLGSPAPVSAHNGVTTLYLENRTPQRQCSWGKDTSPHPCISRPIADPQGRKEQQEPEAAGHKREGLPRSTDRPAGTDRRVSSPAQPSPSEWDRHSFLVKLRPLLSLGFAVDEASEGQGGHTGGLGPWARNRGAILSPACWVALSKTLALSGPCLSICAVKDTASISATIELQDAVLPLSHFRKSRGKCKNEGDRECPRQQVEAGPVTCKGTSIHSGLIYTHTHAHSRTNIPQNGVLSLGNQIKVSFFVFFFFFLYFPKFLH